jgi:hypothetical protein
MALAALLVRFSDLRKRSHADACPPAEPQEERKTMTVPPPRPRRRKPLDAGPFAPEIGSFRLHLAAEGKAAKTVRTYTEAVQWFAAAHLIPRTSCTRWDQVSSHDVQRWLVHLLTRYSDAYASNQFRAHSASACPPGDGRSRAGSALTGPQPLARPASRRPPRYQHRSTRPHAGTGQPASRWPGAGRPASTRSTRARPGPAPPPAPSPPTGRERFTNHAEYLW